MKGISLGRFIAQRRRYLGMTQEELSNVLHVSKSAIAKWETDGGIPDRDNLKNLAEVMKVSIDQLYRIIGNSENQSLEVNITSEVIATLESYGYKVTKPELVGSEDNEKNKMQSMRKEK